MKNQQATTQAERKATAKSKSAPTEKKDENPVATNDAPSGDARDELIRQTAYSFYEARSYVSGYELEDWLKAEMQVDQMLGQKSASSPSAAQTA